MCTSWPCSASLCAHRTKWRDFASPMPRMRRDSGTVSSSLQAPHAVEGIAGEMDERRLRIVLREDRVDVRPALHGVRRAGHDGNRPALAARVAQHRRERIADQVAVCDPRQVDAAGRGEAVPLPEARVHLDELEAAVARVTDHLHLRDAVEGERAEQREPLLHDFVHPDGLADACNAREATGLPDLAAREEPEWLAVGGEVAAER